MPKSNQTNPKGQGPRGGRGLGHRKRTDQGDCSGSQFMGKKKRQRDQRGFSRRNGSGGTNGEARGWKKIDRTSGPDQTQDGKNPQRPESQVDSGGQRRRRWR